MGTFIVYVCGVRHQRIGGCLGAAKKILKLKMINAILTIKLVALKEDGLGPREWEIV